MFTGFQAVFRREFIASFATPLAFVFIVVFLGIQGIFTFYMGQFFAREQADLSVFFAYHPWVYMFLVPSIAMRSWADDRQKGRIELLLTLPISPFGAVAGKYFAALAFVAVALALTFPIWISVNVLGDPDNGVIFASYIGSLLMAATYLAIGNALSALSTNQVVAFISSITVCFLFTVAGLPIVLDAFAWAPDGLVLAIANLSFLVHFDAVTKGVLSLADLLYFLSMICFWLFITKQAIEKSREASS